jgi:plasmid stabilization system protein ParE
LIGYTGEALQQVRAFRRHYETLARDAAIRALDRALSDSEAKIERAPGTGLPAPRPYPQLARPGWAWIKSGRYWVAYRTEPDPVIVAVFFETANIPGRL